VLRSLGARVDVEIVQASGATGEVSGR